MIDCINFKKIQFFLKTYIETVFYYKKCVNNNTVNLIQQYKVVNKIQFITH